MKDQVLSVSQMSHLRDLGVDTSKASMCWLREPNNHTQCEVFIHDDDCYEMSCLDPVPTFTLQDLLDELPHSITNDRLNGLTIEKLSNCWYVYYEVIGFINKEVIKSIRRETLLEAVYEMLCYLAENKLLEKEGK